MAKLSRFFPWRGALVNVKPDTLTRWHRKGFRLLWRWKSKPMGRPQLPKDLRQLIRQIAADNQRAGPNRTPDPQQRWPTFIRNHATTIVACDFCAVVTVSSVRCKYS
jgi:putative transposase